MKKRISDLLDGYEDGSVELIRRAETPKDYFATFDCFPELGLIKK